MTGRGGALRIAHVVPTYIPAWRYGGPIRSVHGLCKALARRGHDVHVYTTTVDGPRNSDVPVDRPVELDGVVVHYAHCPLLRRLNYAPALARALRADAADTDVMHLHAMYLWPNWAASRIAWRAGVPYVVAPKGMLVPEMIRAKSRWLKVAWLRLIDGPMLARAAGVQATSPHELDAFRRMGLPTAGPAFMIPHGIDPPPPPDGTAGDPDRARRIVFLGRVSWIKGLDRLVPALAAVPDAELVVAGNDDEGYTPTLRGLAERHGVADRVRFAGPVEDDAKWSLLRSASVVALPSYSENFGMAAVEAMAAGRPVLVTPEVGLADAIGEAGAGVVVPGDPDAIGRALAALLDDPPALARMGDAARRAAETRFAWDSVAAEMERRYRALLG